LEQWIQEVLEEMKAEMRAKANEAATPSDKLGVSPEWIRLTRALRADKELQQLHAAERARELKATGATTPDPEPPSKLNTTGATTLDPEPADELNTTGATIPNPEPTNELNTTGATTPNPEPINEVNATATTTPPISTTTTTQSLRWLNS
jgi:hypothetical protein